MKLGGRGEGRHKEEGERGVGEGMEVRREINEMKEKTRGNGKNGDIVRETCKRMKKR